MRAYPANQLGCSGSWAVYLSRWWEFLCDDPREANSEGGVFPAIWGTVVMTLIMSMAVVPFGVLAALYLREYAKAGPIVSAVRIAINNLAGVPSIVFGVFGLGFFCYCRRRPDRPTVLSARPGRAYADLRHGRHAVGLADAGAADLAGRHRDHRRSAGGGAQLDARGFVCLRGQQMANDPADRAAAGHARHHDGHDSGDGPRGRRGGAADAGGRDEIGPELPVDGVFPLLHPQRSFMHLGFHIYDVGFQSQNSEAASRWCSRPRCC